MARAVEVEQPGLDRDVAEQLRVLADAELRAGGPRGSSFSGPSPQTTRRQRGSSRRSRARTSASSSGFFSASSRPTLSTRSSPSQLRSRAAPARRCRARRRARSPIGSSRRARRYRRAISEPTTTTAQRRAISRKQPSSSAAATRSARARGWRLRMYSARSWRTPSATGRRRSSGQQRERDGERVRPEQPDRVDARRARARTGASRLTSARAGSSGSGQRAGSTAAARTRASAGTAWCQGPGPGSRRPTSVTCSKWSAQAREEVRERQLRPQTAVRRGGTSSRSRRRVAL